MQIQILSACAQDMLPGLYWMLASVQQSKSGNFWCGTLAGLARSQWVPKQSWRLNLLEPDKTSGKLKQRQAT
jgi:hypothetical protein